MNTGGHVVEDWSSTFLAGDKLGSRWVVRGRINGRINGVRCPIVLIVSGSKLVEVKVV